MKAKITKPDGTVIELEGDAEDVRKVLDSQPAHSGPTFIPYPDPLYPAAPPWVDPSPYRGPYVTWTSSTIDVSGPD